jgi:hypothetical protein
MTDGWPLWARLLAGLGAPLAAAIWLAVYITPVVDRTASAMTQHTLDTQRDTQITIALLRQICRNGAKTELQVQFCDYGLPQWQRP